ncbi:hypothetical protein HID58_047832 [Brassica napus]|uniref:Uncharacterized protein n=1 Tax=Brassica napus TaxID=3708 RepID=A0ABQ8B0F0_BRANA|nr:hypothetical protein HID58_047832 [Brassica napus]
MFHSYLLSLLMICIFLNKTVFDRFIRFSSRTMKTFPSLMLLFCLYPNEGSLMDAFMKPIRFYLNRENTAYLPNNFASYGSLALTSTFQMHSHLLNEEIKGFVKSESVNAFLCFIYL